jgi:hypothetical protein
MRSLLVTMLTEPPLLSNPGFCLSLARMSPESRFAVKARLLSDPSLRGERFRRVRAKLPRPHFA